MFRAPVVGEPTQAEALATMRAVQLSAAAAGARGGKAAASDALSAAPALVSKEAEAASGGSASG